MRLLVIGPPGAGKGTLAEYLYKTFGVVHVSTGNMFRNNIKNKTALGLVAASYIEQGMLVPDEVTNAMVERHFLDEVKQQAFLLDGYPRQVQQAEALDAYLAELGVALDLVIELCVDDELVIERLAGRRVCSVCQAGYHVKNKIPRVEGICDECGGPVVQREDDNEATLKKRLTVFHQITGPLLDFYRQKGLLVELKNSGSILESNQQVRRVLAEKGLI